MNRILTTGLVLLALGAAAFTPQVNVGGRQVTFSWSTPGFSSSTEVAWGPSSAASFDAYPNHSAFTSPISTLHSRTLRRVPPGTYFYRARSTDGTTPQDSAEGTFLVPRSEAFPLGDIAFDAPVLALAKTPTTWYLGGYFTHAGPETGAGILVDPTTGQGVENDFPEVNGQVTAVVSDGRGGLFLSGKFSAVGGLPRSGVAHLLPDHGVDPGFSTSFDDRVNAISLAGGVLYAGGDFTRVNSTSRNHAAAIDAATGALTGWDPNVDQSVDAVAVVGASVYVAGIFSNVNGGALARGYGAAFDLTTGTATAFNPALDAFAVTVTSDGTQVFYGGAFNTAGGSTRHHGASFNAASGALTSWDPNFDGDVTLLSFVASVVYAGGTYFHVNGGTARSYVCALDPGTGVASAFTPLLNGPAYGIAVSGGTAYVAGGFSYPSLNAAAFDVTTGAVRSAWVPSPWGASQAAMLGNDVYLAGSFSLAGIPSYRPNAAAIDATTGALLDWSPQPDGIVEGIQVRGSQVFLAGGFTQLGGAARNSLGSVDGTSGTASAWDPDVDATVDAFQILPDALYACGQFLHVNGGVARSRAAAFDLNTGLATAWAPEVDDECFALTSLGNVVYLGGSFNNAGGTTRHHLAAMDTSGTLTAWDPDTDASAIALTVAGSRILVGGYFTTVNGGLFRPAIAALDASTGAASSFTVMTGGGAVDTLAVAGNTLYLGGPFSTVQGELRPYFAAVDATTAELLPFTASADAKVRAIYPDCGGGGLALGGDFLGSNLSARGSFVATEDPVSCLSDVVTDIQTPTPDAGTSGDAGTAGHRGPLDLAVGWSCTATGAAWSALALLPLLSWLTRRLAR